ncbi:MAG: polysaccharide deacetylase family protein, partial [Clostridia bacterium]|nr:polysaccharide deacetylase family protein [Clostridia bacterium]
MAERDYSSEKIAHSYGVAKNGVANEISINAQKFFETNKFNAFCLDTKSKEKVLYLTFDCGYENGYTSKILDTLKDKNVNAAFFCTLPQVKENPELIKRMIDEGHIVGNHSVTHPSFAEISTEQMTQEVTGMEEYLQEN